MTTHVEKTPGLIAILYAVARATHPVGGHYVSRVVGYDVSTISTWLTKLRHLCLVEVADARYTGGRPMYLYRLTDIGEAVLARHEAVSATARNGAYVR